MKIEAVTHVASLRMLLETSQEGASGVLAGTAKVKKALDVAAKTFKSQVKLFLDTMGLDDSDVEVAQNVANE